jgi:hypothetical protein
MIWFACSKCGKVHGRAENAVGSMIFCTCGQGLTVPWESTAPEPANVPTAEAPAAPVVAQVEPVSFGGPAPVQPLRDEPLRPRISRRGARYHVDPNYCFNHESRPRQKVCDDCGLSFCDDCVLMFRGQTLCGPCKNYEAKLLQRAPQISPLAAVSLLVAFVAGPLMFCLVSLGAQRGLGLIALVPQVFALAAGYFALRKIQSDPGIGGQTLAITGMLTAAFTAVLTVVLTVYGIRAGA